MARPLNQLRKLAGLLGVAPTELLDAIIMTVVEGKAIPPSGMVNLQVRVPVNGQREMPFRADSRISIVAKCLHMEPEDVRDALLAMHPEIVPGHTITFQVRAQAGNRDLILPELPYAIDAAGRGDKWAARWLELARRQMADIE